MLIAMLKTQRLSGTRFRYVLSYNNLRDLRRKMSSQPGIHHIFTVTALDRELYLALGLDDVGNPEAILSGHADHTDRMQRIAGHREKQAILSTLSALSNALSALSEPPSLMMQNLVSESLGELQRMMDITDTTGKAGAALGTVKIPMKLMADDKTSIPPASKNSNSIC